MNDRAEQSFATAAGPRTIRMQRRLPGPVERVWRYLVEDDLRAQWLASGTLEPRVGGEVLLVFRHADLSPVEEPRPARFADGPEEHRGTERVTRFEPPHRLGLTWGGDSEVVFELTPDGTDVLLTLSHAKLASRAEMVDVAAGWHAHLAMLTARAEGRDPPGFWSTWDGLEEEYDQRLPKD